MSGWTFYNAVRDAMRRMAAERDDEPKAIGNYIVGEHGPEAGTDPPDAKR